MTVALISSHFFGKCSRIHSFKSLGYSILRSSGTSGQYTPSFCNNSNTGLKCFLSKYLTEYCANIRTINLAYASNSAKAGSEIYARSSNSVNTTLSAPPPPRFGRIKNGLMISLSCISDQFLPRIPSGIMPVKFPGLDNSFLD